MNFYIQDIIYIILEKWYKSINQRNSHNVVFKSSLTYTADASQICYIRKARYREPVS